MAQANAARAVNAKPLDKRQTNGKPPDGGQTNGNGKPPAIRQTNGNGKPPAAKKTAKSAAPVSNSARNAAQNAVTSGITAGLNNFKALAFDKLFGVGKVTTTAQQSIPYIEMRKDGICRVTDRLYSKTAEFDDISYHLAEKEAQIRIFGEWSKLLNYFDDTMFFELTFVNLYGNLKDFMGAVQIREQDDAFNDSRREFSDMLKNQLSKGNNGLTRRKYITVGVEADTLKEAKPRLERMESDILSKLKARSLGVKARSLDGKERLEVMFGQFNGGKEPFRFDWKDIPNSGLSTKDYIAPPSFDFRNGKIFRMGDLWGATSFIQINTNELSDRLLADLLDVDAAMSVTIHIRALEQQKAIKNIKGKVSDISKMKIEEQKKAVRAGYDMDLIPSDLNTYGEDAQNLLKDLQSRDERMFMVTVLVVNTAETKKKLDSGILAVKGVAQRHNCPLKRLDFQQEQGLMSSLPLGLNLIEIQRGLTTSSVAGFVPFTTQELFQDGESCYYGTNPLSNNLIMVNRKEMKNPNGLVFGVPGSGKSFSCKREMMNVFLTTGDDIVCLDPEGEYFPLVMQFGGQVIKLSPSSKHYINPMDINVNYSFEDGDDPVRTKSDFVLSLCELVVGGKQGLQPTEKTIIDRCVKQVYQKWVADPRPENVPILEDLYNAIKEQSGNEAEYIATALEMYVTGSLNVFNHQTNVDISNRFVCYDIKELGTALKPLGMLIVQDQVWGRVTANRNIDRKTWYYIDEFHLLLRDEQTGKYSTEFYKRFRKWGGIPTAMTQNVKDMLASKDIENILENTLFFVLLSQAAGDREILSNRLEISEHQLGYVTNSQQGEGLLICDGTILPFSDKFPKDTNLYRIMSTKPGEAILKA